MKFLIIGLVAGIALGFAPWWPHRTGTELYPEWHGSLAYLNEIEPTAHPALAARALPPLALGNTLVVLAATGAERSRFDLGESHAAASRDGRFLVRYEKVGKSVEYLNMAGEPFWKLRSLEYPHISPNGKLVLLLNGDQTRVRFVDNNGNEIGAKEASGRLCTQIAFAKRTDRACVAFLDGSWLVVDARGEIRASGVLPGNPPIKSAALSDGGAFAALHYGGAKHDCVAVVRTDDKKIKVIELSSAHLTRTGLFVSDDGSVAVIDREAVLVTEGYSRRGESIRIPARRPGHARIDRSADLYVASYTRETGEAAWLLFRPDGTVLMHRELPEESFLDCHIEDGLMLLRGSRTLQCYSVRS